MNFKQIGNIKNGEQEISLSFSSSSTCLNKGTIVHELCHALGFYHEQNRPDRDNYVTINFANIDSDKTNNFEKYNGLTWNTPYDFGSIMHYTEYAFSNNGQKTIIPKIPGIVLKNSGDKTDAEILTQYDVDAIRSRYQCPGAYTLPPTTTTTTTTTRAPILASCTNKVENCGAYSQNKDTYCNPNFNYALPNGMKFREGIPNLFQLVI